jgi:hypothetical protein
MSTHQPGPGPDTDPDTANMPGTASTAGTESLQAQESAARATSFGSFKPVGHVMVGLPNRQSLLALKAELRKASQPGLIADELTPTESVQDMQALIDDASPLAGFGHEIALMRRYLELAQQGYSWLVVKVDSDEEAARLAELARAQGATLAVRYGWLTVEDLI